MKRKFKAGDKIRMLEGCGSLPKGSIQTLQLGSWSGRYLYELWAGNQCTCQDKWQLVKKPITKRGRPQGSKNKDFETVVKAELKEIKSILKQIQKRGTLRW